MPQPIDMKRFAQLKNAGDLPSPRGVALAIIRLTQSSDVSLAELGRVIKGDPAFVGRLIKTANGMVADGRRAVVSVQDALMVLGLPAVRSLALGFSLLSNYRKGACKGFDYEQFWSSSLLMALAMHDPGAARARGRAGRGLSASVCVGRIGELALATLYPEAFGRLLGELQRSPGLQQAALEDQAFAMNHRELGAAMLADWGIPEALVQPVRFYEQPELAGFAEQSREEGLVQCLVLARAIARFSMVPEQEHASLLPPMLRLSSRLGFARADFVSLCERIGRTWREWGKLLHLKTGELPDFDRLAAASEAALIEAAPAHGGASAAASTDGPPRRALLMSRDGGEEAALVQLRAGLVQAGLDSFEAHEAGAALEQVVDLQPQVAVVVWCAEGARFVRSLREMRLGRGVHVLAVVSDDEAMLAAALAAGADDFLVAPLTGLQVSLRLRGSLRALELKDELERERETARHFAAEAAICNRRLHEAALIDVLTGPAQPPPGDRGDARRVGRRGASSPAFVGDRRRSRRLRLHQWAFTGTMWATSRSDMPQAFCAPRCACKTRSTARGGDVVFRALARTPRSMAPCSWPSACATRCRPTIWTPAGRCSRSAQALAWPSGWRRCRRSKSSRVAPRPARGWPSSAGATGWSRRSARRRALRATGEESGLVARRRHLWSLDRLGL